MDRPRPRLLVIDDERLILEGLSRLLRADWETRTASSREAALVEFQSGRFDAVLCDLNIGAHSGLTLIEEVVALRPAYRGRVILMTGSIPDPAMVGRLEALEVPCIPKPCDWEVLTELLRKAAARPWRTQLAA